MRGFALGEERGGRTALSVRCMPAVARLKVAALEDGSVESEENPSYDTCWKVGE